MAESTMTTDGAAVEDWVDLCGWDEVPVEGGKYVLVGRLGLAVFREDGVPRVMDNMCPHAGAALAGGWVQSGRVICPRHGWEFELKSGACPDAPSITVPVYEARLNEGRVQIRLAQEAVHQNARL